MLVDVRRGASNGNIHRMDSAVLNETVEGRVAIMRMGKIFTDMSTFLGGVRQWYEHNQLCL